jgi:hypothetical protein
VARRDQKRHIVIVNWDKYNKPPRAALSSTHRKDYDKEPLSWFRLECNWYRDVDILDLKPSVRSLWPQLLAMAAASIPHGTVFTSVQSCSKAGNLDEVEVAEAFALLWKRRKIRYSPAGKNQPTASHPAGHVPTYLRTNERTGDGLKKDDEGSAMSKIARGAKYADDPKCGDCGHAKVIHQGPHHAGRCIDVKCSCTAFAPVAA